MGIKLRKLYELPKAVPYFSRELRRQGFSAKNLSDAQKGGVLKRLATGLYAFSGAPVSSWALVEALQKQGWPHLSVGGPAALNVLGYSQYKRSGLLLLSPKQVHLPALQNLFEEFRIKTQVSRLFGNSRVGLQVYEIKGSSLNVSSLERAILETISLMPSEISSEELSEIFEHLPPFSEELLKSLLKLCRSKRVIRIFAFLCESHHQKFKKLTYETMMKNSGKSLLYVDKREKSEFDRYWRLMVPEAWAKKRRERVNVELP